MISLVDMRTFVDNKKVELTLLKSSLDKLEAEIEQTETDVVNLTEAKNIISEASRVTQVQFQTFVEELTTLAIQAMFPAMDYKFVVDFELKGGRSQINLLVQQGDKEPYSPSEEQGGAMLDIISFALRIILWTLEKPRSRATLIFDEPFRWSGALTIQAANFMKEISQKLNIQMIIITHEDNIAEIADRSWRMFRGQYGYSEVEVIKQSEESPPAIKIQRRRKI